MNWQEILTIAVAAACALWVLWVTLRPFVRKVVSACGGCSSCGPEEEDELLHIAPMDSQHS